MNESLTNMVSNLGHPRILIVGDFMLDVYIYGDATRISPEAPVPVLKVRNVERSCGGAASVALDVAALGAKPICLGIVGADDNAQNLIDLLQQAGTDTSGLIQTADRPTITKTRLVGLAQHRHQQQLFRMDEEVTSPLDRTLNHQILDTFRARLAEVEVVCLQDYDKGLLSPGLSQAMIEAARTAGKKVLVDPACGTVYSKYRGATLITPNRQETALAVGFELDNRQAYTQAAQWLRRNLDLEAAVITLDKDGAYLQTESQGQLLSTRPRKVYDVTGAGDMVLAMLAVAVAGGCDYVTAVQLANIAGGIEVEKFGVATVTIEEIIHELMSQHSHPQGKIRRLEELLPELTWHRRQQHPIVFTNGCFDVLHRGHVEYLQFCRQQGEVVILGLNSDASIRAIKGPQRPINSQEDRAAVLAGLDCIDYIILFDEPDPFNLINTIKPDILVKGQDWQDKGVIGADVVQAHGGRVVFAPLVEGRSSTAVIERIKTQDKEIGE